MKKTVLLSALVFLLISCNKTPDKKAQLSELIKQRDKLSEQIGKLQQEIASSDTSAGAKMKVKNILVTVVKPEAFNHYIEIQGKVDGDDNIAVSPRTPGVVIKINVHEGDKVSKGQVLAELDAEMIRKGIDELTESLNFATTLYNKQKSLWDQKLGSEVQYLQAKNTKESLENKMNTLKEQLSMTKIISPINGSVEEIPIKIGQSLAPGLTAVRVISFAKIKVVADIAESWASKVKSGDHVIIRFPDLNKEVDAKLSFSSKFINPTNRTFQVEARFDNQALDLKANMIAVLKINDYAVENAITTQVNAIQRSQDGEYVFVVKDENNKMVAHRQTIKSGMVYNGLAEVLSGLRTGDKVVTFGYQDLNDGQYVRF